MHRMQIPACAPRMPNKAYVSTLPIRPQPLLSSSTCIVVVTGSITPLDMWIMKLFWNGYWLIRRTIPGSPANPHAGYTRFLFAMVNISIIFILPHCYRPCKRKMLFMENVEPSSPSLQREKNDLSVSLRLTPPLRGEARGLFSTRALLGSPFRGAGTAGGCD